MALGQFPAHRGFAVSEFTAYRIERRWQSARRLEENKRRLNKSQRFQALRVVLTSRARTPQNKIGQRANPPHSTRR